MKKRIIFPGVIVILVLFIATYWMNRTKPLPVSSIYYVQTENGMKMVNRYSASKNILRIDSYNANNPDVVFSRILTDTMQYYWEPSNGSAFERNNENTEVLEVSANWAKLVEFVKNEGEFVEKIEDEVGTVMHYRWESEKYQQIGEIWIDDKGYPVKIIERFYNESILSLNNLERECVVYPIIYDRAISDTMFYPPASFFKMCQNTSDM